MDDPMKVLVVEPMKAPYEREISGSLASMQEVVGGDIEATYPFTDPVGLVCNSEGKFLGLPPNRLLYDDNGVPYDMVCGTFFLAGLGDENFVSLTPEQSQKYQRHFGRHMIFAIPKDPAKTKKKEKNYHER